MPENSSKPLMKSSSYYAQQRTIKSLTLWEKLDSIPVVITVLSNATFALITGLFREKGNRKRAYIKYISNTIARTLTRRASPRLLHYLVLPTDDVYEQVCKKQGVETRSETLEDGTQAHWIGNPASKNVIINFHGGGYVLPASPEMFLFYFQLISRIESAGKSAAVLFLSYDLAPTSPYPRALSQAVSLLKHVHETLCFSPENIILTGDSAGGNLVLGVLSHITHPHPDLSIPRLTLPSFLKGTILISPWASFSTTGESYAQNHYLDPIHPKAISKWSAAFLGTSLPSTPYSEPAIAPSTWWAHLPVSEVLILYGGDETLADGIREFCGKFKEGFEIIAPEATSSSHSRVSTPSRGEITSREADSHLLPGEIPFSKFSSQTSATPQAGGGGTGNGVEEGSGENEGGLSKGEKRLTIVEVQGEFHNEMFLDWQAREERECVQGRGVKEWVMRRL